MRDRMPSDPGYSCVLRVGSLFMILACGHFARADVGIVFTPVEYPSVSASFSLQEMEDEFVDAEDGDAFVPPDGEVDALAVPGAAGLVRRRCEPRMRNVLRIAHGASPDGRPEGCRMFSFLRRFRTRYAPPVRRRILPALRYQDPREFALLVSGELMTMTPGTPIGAHSGPPRIIPVQLQPGVDRRR